MVHAGTSCQEKGTNIIHKYGYSWCGGTCRWGTSEKLRILRRYIGDNYDYVGIASDEPQRLAKYNRTGRILPLAEWGITEPEALQYCYDRGFYWEENGIRLYDILDRVSCWCCGNKNLKELYNIYQYLPSYWDKLKDLQQQTERTFRRDSGKSILDMENEFQKKHLLQTKK